MPDDVVHVQYVQERALARIGDRAFQVDPRARDGRLYACPTELISAALGS